ncbi:MAG: DUF1553 domain-containing protein [Planctomycetes bacterium]|nr:DUF1553 domain-containing protein [Planctomycetota bacterium]
MLLRTRLVPLFLIQVTCLAPLAAQDGVTFFKKEIRPLLQAHCVKCHGNGASFKGGLRLTHRTFLIAGGQSGPAVDSDAPKRSRLLQMVSYKDDHHRMPPTGKLPQEKLDALHRWVEMGAPWPDGPVPEVLAPEKKKLGRDDGLAGWAYSELTRPEEPAVADKQWATSGMDLFILDTLERAGLTPAPAADKVTLIRRASYDLIGLPPTREEVRAFVQDRRPDAFARVLDGLLSRPQYGEKWGRHWLDLVRYGETNGYERDSDKRHVWRYRDWVIDAFNKDKPYDRMITEQLAGDELDDVTPESIVATGFLRLMQWDDEPGQGNLQARYDVLDDILVTSTEAFLGMTIGCARCHDHKGDPISQEEYYQFMSYFVGMTEMSINGVFTPIASSEEEQVRAVAEKKKQADEARIVEEMRALEGQYLSRLAARAGEAGQGDLVGLKYRFYRDTWETMPDFDMLLAESQGELPSGLLDLTVASREESIGVVYEGKLRVPRAGRYTFNFKTRMHPRLVLDGDEVMGRESKRSGGLWRATVALNAGLIPFRVDYWNRAKGHGLEAWWGPASAASWRYVTEEPGDGWHSAASSRLWKTGKPGFGSPGTPGAAVGTEWHSEEIWLRSTFDWEPSDAESLILVAHHDEDLEVWINGVPALRQSGYRVDYSVFEISAAARGALKARGNVLAVHCRQTGGGQYVHVAPAHRSDLGGGSLVDIAFGRRDLSVRKAQRERKNLEGEVRKNGKKILGEADWKRYEELRKQRDQVRRRRLPEVAMAMAVQERGRNAPEMHVHVRGNAHVKGKRVQPGVPSCLETAPPPPDPQPRERSSGRRRALAAWISNPKNPVTSRVAVNRVFQHHFGRGIVASSSDFGEFGERPTHPRLLDWLACELVDNGWSLKKLHRTIMLSSAYRMSSRADAAALEKDPANRLFWRFDPRRLTAEEIRDSMLWVAGILNLKMGGPSFYSLMPREVLATSSRPNQVWGKSSDEERHRRSIYIKVKRSLLTPILSNFDLADTDRACPVRFNTTTPTQALHVLNGEFTRLMADAFARRLTAEHGKNDAARVRRGLELVTGREPGDRRVREHLDFLAQLRSDHALDDHDALKMFCLVCLNANAFMYLD